VIFDMDGTLFDSRTAIVPSVREALQTVARDSGWPDTLPDDAEIGGHIGEPSKEFYLNVTPSGLRHHVDRIADLVRAGEKKRIEAGETRLFDGVSATLSALRDAGLKIAFYSNSGPGYFYTVLRAHRILDFASAATCYGETKAGKGEMVRTLGTKLGARALAVVGDRAHDVQAAKENSAFAVGVLYGFGDRLELGGADVLLERFGDLPGKLP
jgi:phosphoglycolate phosphatase-like HAD superfamily hydrolase